MRRAVVHLEIGSLTTFRTHSENTEVFVPPPTPAAFSVKYSVGSMSSYVGMVVVPFGFETVTSFAVSFLFGFND